MHLHKVSNKGWGWGEGGIVKLCKAREAKSFFLSSVKEVIRLFQDFSFLH